MPTDEEAPLFPGWEEVNKGWEGQQYVANNPNAGDEIKACAIAWDKSTAWATEKEGQTINRYRTKRRGWFGKPKDM